MPQGISRRLWQWGGRLLRGPALPEQPVSGKELDAAAWRALLDAFPAPVLVLNARRVVIEANGQALEIFGSHLLNHDLAHSLRQPAALEAANAVLNGAPHKVSQVMLAVPVQRFFELHALPVQSRGKDGARVALSLLDITAQRHVEQMRADFVANVSHELRSPLVSLLGFIETLKGPARNDAAAREKFLGIMHSEAQRMARLIDDLLSLSRVEVNEHIRPRGRVDIARLMAAAKSALEERAVKRGVTIELDCPAELPKIAGDQDQIAEVLHNLLDNALKYGALGRPVRIAARRVGRIPEIGGPGVCVSIHNEGEPIAPEHLPRLTERFYRVDQARSREIGGTGLGLAIVKHIVSRHRGRLSVESDAASGSTFSVFLPEAPPEEIPGAPQTA